jgi:hypothetical protein
MSLKQRHAQGTRLAERGHKKDHGDANFQTQNSYNCPGKLSEYTHLQLTSFHIPALEQQMRNSRSTELRSNTEQFNSIETSATTAGSNSFF